MSKEEITVGVFSPLRSSFESAKLVELGTDRKGYTYWGSYRPVSILDSQGVGVIIQATIDKGCSNG